MLVDGGGFFPDDSMHIDFSWFLMDGMKLLGTDAVGLGDRDLRFGLGYLKAQVKRTQLPMVCANLVDKRTRTTAFAPFLIKKIGSVNVGVFGLMSDKVDLGPARDTLAVQEPQMVAKRIVPELRAKGATVVVLLSQLGKVESEDLVTAVDGIDEVVVGRNVPLLQKGRLIKSTMACYGGEQGQYLGRTILNLNAARKVVSADNECFILGPEVGENADVLQIVKDFEDKYNEKERKMQMEQAAKANTQTSGADTPDRFIGTEVCERCHATEAQQWETTKHAHAWQTLVDLKKDATPDCVPCHVVGYNKPGGFTNSSATPKMVNVGCENCHGMGSRHEAFTATPPKITEQTCMQCHTSSSSPTFDFAVYSPHVFHKFTGKMPEIPAHESPMKKAAMGH